MNRADFDLNLLRVFQGVYFCGNVHRAAERLGLSQPAVSHSLTRLRLQLKDPLFVRAPGGVAPTLRAQRFARTVDEVLAKVGSALDESQQFDPLQSERSFSIHLSDVGQGAFLPFLMEHLTDHAPHLRIQVTQLAPDQVLPALEQGRLDLAIGYLPMLRGTEHEQLDTDHYVLVMRADHPQAAAKAVNLSALTFVDVASHTAPGRALTQAGLGANVRLTLPQFSAVPDVLRCSNLAAIVPHRAALRFAQLGALCLRELPLELPAMAVWSHWCWRAAYDPGHRWLRETMARLYKR